MTTELLGMYKENVAPPVFALIIELMNYDVSSRQPSKGEAAKEDSIDGDAETGADASRSTSRRGPPSETDSHDWDKLTDPGPSSTA